MELVITIQKMLTKMKEEIKSGEKELASMPLKINNAKFSQYDKPHFISEVGFPFPIALISKLQRF